MDNSADGLAARIKANLDQAQVNLEQIQAGWLAIEANNNLIKSAKWRLIRNRRLLSDAKAQLARTRQLLGANGMLITENAALLAMHRAHL